MDKYLLKLQFSKKKCRKLFSQNLPLTEFFCFQWKKKIVELYLTIYKFTSPVFITHLCS